MQSILVLTYNKKKGTVQKAAGGKEFKLAARMEIPVTWDEFITQGKVGFEALHEKLAMLAKEHQFALQPVLELIATASVLRKVYFVRDCGVPLYVTMMMFKLLQEARACTGGSGSLRKTVEYVMFLRQIVPIRPTLASVNSGQVAKQKYVIPAEVDDMSVEMLLEEIRMAEELEAKPTLIARLNKKLNDKRNEIREKTTMKPAQKGKPARRMTEFEQVQAVIREDKDAEYSDVPSTKKKKRRT